jgi:23S rRNA G2445 N2-methylase RlmL
VLATEIASPDVGGQVTQVHASGVEFSGDSMATGYAACMWLRTAVRVLCLVAATTDIRAESDVGEDDYSALYSFVRKAAAWDVLLVGGTRSFSIQVRESEAAPTQQPIRGRGSGRRGSRDGGAGAVVFGVHKAQVCGKDAICDALRDVGLEAPPRPESHATSDVPLFLALHRGQATLYRDMAGSSLHKRGYRSDTPLHRSSLNEAVAAGMLYLAGFQTDGAFRSPRKRREHAETVPSGDSTDASGKIEVEQKHKSLVVLEYVKQ